MYTRNNKVQEPDPPLVTVTITGTVVGVWVGWEGCPAGVGVGVGEGITPRGRRSRPPPQVNPTHCPLTIVPCPLTLVPQAVPLSLKPIHCHSPTTYFNPHIHLVLTHKTQLIPTLLQPHPSPFPPAQYTTPVTVATGSIKSTSGGMTMSALSGAAASFFFGNPQVSRYATLSPPFYISLTR